jgi:PAS domain-containing protein
MKQTTSTEKYAEATDLRNRDQHIGSVEVETLACFEASDESPAESVEAIDRTDAAGLWPNLRASVAIVLVFQSIYLAADWGRSEARHEAILPLHILNIIAAVIFFGLMHLRASRGRMPQLVLGGCALLFATTTALAILTLNCAPLTVTLTITMMAAAGLVPWNWRWQAGLAIAALGSMAALTLIRSDADPHLGYDWLAIVSAAGVAHYVALSGQRYRREIASRIMAFQVNHRQLLTEVAAREGAIQRLGQSEAKLRKIFETSNEMITISRQIDGHYLEVNEAFFPRQRLYA